jgi:hypothetical protein
MENDIVVIRIELVLMPAPVGSLLMQFNAAGPGGIAYPDLCPGKIGALVGIVLPGRKDPDPFTRRCLQLAIIEILELPDELQ